MASEVDEVASEVDEVASEVDEVLMLVEVDEIGELVISMEETDGGEVSVDSDCCFFSRAASSEAETGGLKARGESEAGREVERWRSKSSTRCLTCCMRTSLRPVSSVLKAWTSDNVLVKRTDEEISAEGGVDVDDDDVVVDDDDDDDDDDNDESANASAVVAFKSRN